MAANVESIISEMVGPGVTGGIMWVLLKVLFNRLKTEFDEVKERISKFEKKINDIDKDLAVKTTIIENIQVRLKEIKQSN